MEPAGDLRRGLPLTITGRKQAGRQAIRRRHSERAQLQAPVPRHKYRVETFPSRGESEYSMRVQTLDSESPGRDEMHRRTADELTIQSDPSGRGGGSALHPIRSRARSLAALAAAFACGGEDEPRGTQPGYAG